MFLFLSTVDRTAICVSRSNLATFLAWRGAVRSRTTGMGEMSVIGLEDIAASNAQFNLSFGQGLSRQ